MSLRFEGRFRIDRDLLEMPSRATPGSQHFLVVSGNGEC